MIIDSTEIIKMEEDFQTTLRESKRVTLLECRKRNFMYKFAGKLLRLVAPLL